MKPTNLEFVLAKVFLNNTKYSKIANKAFNKVLSYNFEKK